MILIKKKLLALRVSYGSVLKTSPKKYSSFVHKFLFLLNKLKIASNTVSRGSYGYPFAITGGIPSTCRAPLR